MTLKSHGAQLSNPFPGTMDPLLLKDFPEHCQFICMEIQTKEKISEEKKKAVLKDFGLWWGRETF